MIFPLFLGCSKSSVHSPTLCKFIRTVNFLGAFLIIATRVTINYLSNHFGFQKTRNFEEISDIVLINPFSTRVMCWSVFCMSTTSSTYTILRSTLSIDLSWRIFDLIVKYTDLQKVLAFAVKQTTFFDKCQQKSL